VVKPKKGESTKNARIPKDQLLDLIFTAFREFQFWSMKALRQRTQQPDAYLRQVLEEVAVLNKSGKFANTYSLTDAYKDKSADPKLEAADEDDDDDDEEEMEDVV
jgi:transcription initiation factor TFIIF subunit beta